MSDNEKDFVARVILQGDHMVEIPCAPRGGIEVLPDGALVIRDLQGWVSAAYAAGEWKSADKDTKMVLVSPYEALK